MAAEYTDNPMAQIRKSAKVMERQSLKLATVAAAEKATVAATGAAVETNAVSLESLASEFKSMKKELANANEEVEKLKRELRKGDKQQTDTNLSDVTGKPPLETLASMRQDIENLKRFQNEIEVEKKSEQEKRDRLADTNLSAVTGMPVYVQPLGHDWFGLRYHIHYKKYYEDHLRSKCLWVAPNSPSITLQAFTIFLGRKNGIRALTWWELFKFFARYLWFFLLIFSLQIFMLNRLWGSLPDLNNNPKFCLNSEIGPRIQMCAIGIFLLALSASFRDIFLELLIIKFSKRRCRLQPLDDWVKDALTERYFFENYGAYNKDEDRKKKIDEKYTSIPEEDLVSILNLSEDSLTRYFLLILALMELAVALAVLVVGCKYIMSAQTISDLVQTTVAVEFIDRVDNSLCEVFFSSDDPTEPPLYEVPVLLGDDHLHHHNKKGETEKMIWPRDYVQWGFQIVSGYLSLHAITLFTVGIVFGMRNSYC